MIANAAKTVSKKHTENPARQTLPQSKRIQQFILFCLCSASAGYAYVLEIHDSQLAAGFLLLPALLVAILVVAFALQELTRRSSGLVLLSSRNPVLAVFFVMCVIAVCLLDMTIDRPPVLLIPGTMALALVYWSQPRIVLFGIGAIALGLVTGIVVLANISIGEYAAFFAFAAFITVLTTMVIRGAAFSNRQRVQSLEYENRELWNLSHRDPLTGLYNRRYIEQAAKIVFNRAIRYRESLHVLMIDIDHFKKVNDTLGHAVGDEVLKAVAASIHTFIRASDIMARYGGEEFIVYIVESSTETTQYVANRIRDGVASMRLDIVPWPITISIGIASIREDDTIDNQIARADQSLYLSKRNGRNRVTGS